MDIRHPWILLVLPICLAYVVGVARPWQERIGRRRWLMVLVRSVLVTVLLLALAGLQVRAGSDRLGVALLVDLSDSVSAASQEKALSFINEALEHAGPDDVTVVVPFAARPMVEWYGEGKAEIGQIHVDPERSATDIEAAIQFGAGLQMDGAARRIVVLSDGQHTRGDPLVAALVAQRQGVQIDVVDLASDQRTDEAWISSISAPAEVYPNEVVQVRIQARATRHTPSTISVLQGGRVLARHAITLAAGVNNLVIPIAGLDAGFSEIRAVLSPVRDEHPQNNTLATYTRVEGRPMILLVTPEPAAVQGLRAVLQAASYRVQTIAPEVLPVDAASLLAYDAVIIADVPARRLSSRVQDALVTYVRDLGGGLLAVGGRSSYGVGGWYRTALEEILPVEMVIRAPDRFPPTAIVAVIDKSGSMATLEQGTPKIRLAAEAAARVAELINPTDEITVIAFDDRPADVLGPVTGARSEELISQLLRLQAGGGGIYVLESLDAALSLLRDSSREVRHVILLADGSDAEHQQGVRELIEQDFVETGTSLSVVAIGHGSDLGFLQQIAEQGGGRYYFTASAHDLPTIFAEEAQLALRSYIVEEPFTARQTAASPILAGIDALPPLGGYVATSPKQMADVILVSHLEDPLLASWQFGLGRAVAWTSDGGARWANDWVEGPDAVRLWVQAVRWVTAAPRRGDAVLDIKRDGQQAYLTLDAVEADGGARADLNGLDVLVLAVGPDGQTYKVLLPQIAPGRYQGSFTPAMEGAYAIRVSGQDADDTELVALTTGWSLGYSPEYASLDREGEALTDLARVGGGSLLARDEPERVYRPMQGGSSSRHDLGPLLLIAGLLLLPVDVGVRRLTIDASDLRAALLRVSHRSVPTRHRREERAAGSPAHSTLARLSRAKDRAGQERPAAVEGDAREQQGSPSLRPRTGAEPSATPGPAHTEPSPSQQAHTEDGTLAARLLRTRRDRGRDIDGDRV